MHTGHALMQMNARWRLHAVRSLQHLVAVNMTSIFIKRRAGHTHARTHSATMIPVRRTCARTSAWPMQSAQRMVGANCDVAFMFFSKLSWVERWLRSVLGTNHEKTTIKNKRMKKSPMTLLAREEINLQHQMFAGKFHCRPWPDEQGGDFNQKLN